MKRRWSLSLAGQLALLVALALFVAQAVNFALLLRERNAFRFAQVTLPAVTRLVDAAERVRSGRPLALPRSERDDRSRTPDRVRRGDRGLGIRMASASPLPLPGEAADDVQAAVVRGFADAGVPVGRVAATVGPVDASRIAPLDRRRAERWRRMGATLTLAVELPGRGWLVHELPWPVAERGILWRLIAQTLILYGIVLLPVLWIGRRVARPLNALAASARDFRPGTPAAPVAEEGPGDVRAVIAAFNGMGRRVTAMLDEKDRMLGAIGHDLRTPLAALRVRIEMVDDDTDRQRMSETVDEMARTLEDILSLARLGRPSEPVTEVDLAALVDAVVEDFRDLGADVMLAEVGRTTLSVRPTLMRRAVRNLIENAVKYGERVEVALESDARSVRIVVADHGPGIPDDRLATVFQPFTRLESSRNRDTGGIGLGLALARAIVEEAGGTITLANRTVGGLAATIVLPR